MPQLAVYKNGDLLTKLQSVDDAWGAALPYTVKHMIAGFMNEIRKDNYYHKKDILFNDVYTWEWER